MVRARKQHCGFVAIVGRPNVGKSTLLNRILGQKLSITSRKPQTTRHRILGIKTEDAVQTVYVDTPGLHREGKRAMHRLLNRSAREALAGVDVVLLVSDSLFWTAEDQDVLDLVARGSAPVVLVINKVDKVKDKAQLLPHIESMNARFPFAAICPVSARDGGNVAQLEQQIQQMLPAAPFMFPVDQLTDRSERFLAAELVREKLMRSLGQELPHALTVEIEQFKEQRDKIRIHALIWVEREGQKAIVIGRQGKVLKQVGTLAREDMERLFGRAVFLELWVKVKENWSDDERALRSLGYNS